MNIASPISLTVPTAPSVTADILRNAAETGDVFAIVSGQPEYGGCVIAYGGLQLKVSVTDAIDIKGFKHIFCNVDEKSIGSVISIELGGHLDGGDKVPGIVKAMLTAAVGIGQMTDAFAAMWMPAKTISGFDYFARVVADYDQGGVFPVLALVNFKKTDDGSIRSKGLDWLAGQELVVASSGLSDSEMMRRIVRVSHDLAVGGPVDADIELAGIDENELILLAPEKSDCTLNMRASFGLVH